MDAGTSGNTFEKIVIAAVCSLLLLAVISILYVARPLLLPIFLAVFLALVLQGPARRLANLGLPRPAAAILIMLGLGCVLSGAVYQFTVPAMEWIDRIPSISHKIEREFWQLRQSLEAAEEATEQIEEMTAGGDDDEERVVVAEASLADRLVGHIGIVLGEAAITIGLLFFLLAFGQATMERVVQAFETRGARQRLRSVLRDIEARSALYVRTFTLINIGVGTATGLSLWLLGVPNPGLWGLLATTLNYIPYLGPTVMVGVLSVVSVVTFNEPLDMALPVIAFLVITTIEGQFLTPSVMGRQLTLNPIAVFVTIVAWFWIWGVDGAIIAVPLLASIKIAADQIESLKPLSAFLDRPVPLQRQKTQAKPTDT